MEPHNEQAFLPVFITLSAWDCAVDRFSIAEWERRQLVLIKAAQHAWSKRSVPEERVMTFALILFVHLGEEVSEITEYFAVKYDNDSLFISSVNK